MKSLVSAKNGNTALIFNKGRNGDSRNFHPISLTSVPGEIVGQVLLEALIMGKKDRQVIQDCQYDFTIGTTYLTKQMAFCVGALDKERAMDVIYLVFCKAFDNGPSEQRKNPRLTVKFTRFFKASTEGR